MSDAKVEADLDLYADTSGGDANLDAQLNENEVLGEEPAIVNGGEGTHVENEAALLDESIGAGDDLFEAALTESSSANQSAPSVESPGLTTNNQYQRRYSCYVGNMTWWTTDSDLADSLASAGLGDLIDIKFYENRNNGQSKGFATVAFNNEVAMRQCMEKIAGRQLHGQQLVAMPYNKTSLSQLEAATRRPNERPEKRDDGGRSGGERRNDSKGGDKGALYLGTFRCGPSGAPPPVSGPPMRGPPQHSMAPPPVVGPPIVLPPGAPPGRVPFGMPPTRIGPPMSAPVVPPPSTNRPPPGFPPAQLPSRYHQPPPNAPPPGFPAGAHVNPNVYPGLAGGVPQMMPPEQLSEAEFEEIMNRNRTVSSSAISRAVSDAAAGDYASAIETLVTAISLIRQSRVAPDDRCKVLITSLQDTLHGIEAKSYARRSKDRSRDRSRSPDRSRKRHRRSRSRSRSRERYEYSPRHSRRY